MVKTFTCVQGAKKQNNFVEVFFFAVFTFEILFLYNPKKIYNKSSRQTHYKEVHKGLCSIKILQEVTCIFITFFKLEKRILGNRGTHSKEIKFNVSMTTFKCYNFGWEIISQNLWTGQWRFSLKSNVLFFLKKNCHSGGKNNNGLTTKTKVPISSPKSSRSHFLSVPSFSETFSTSIEHDDDSGGGTTKRNLNNFDGCCLVGGFVQDSPGGPPSAGNYSKLSNSVERCAIWRPHL